MRKKIYGGVDGGLSGGLCFIDEDEKIFFKTIMPVIKSAKGKSVYDIQRIVDIFEEVKPDKVYLEKSLIFPGAGSNAHASTAFCNGIFQGILGALKISYDIISPKRWQKEMFKGMSRTDTKQASVLLARRLYPTEDWTATERSKKYHDGLTDSLNIALFCKRDR